MKLKVNTALAIFVEMSREAAFEQFSGDLRLRFRDYMIDTSVIRVSRI